MGTVAPTTPTRAALWTLETAGEFLNVTDRSLRRYIAEGRLPAYRLGSRQIRVRRADVEALLVPIPAAWAAANEGRRAKSFAGVATSPRPSGIESRYTR